MSVLTPQQRNTLEAAVKQARRIAETGALNALQGLAINNPEPFTHMSAEQRALRNSLRSKARLLGDVLLADGIQNVNHLSYELAYESWHKMLFAKFLEANGLLMHPDGVAVTMEDCEELAKDEGFVDKWDAAAGYASKMLPAIFRTDDPLMQVAYATDERIKLEEIIDALENQIFIADDALGWVYQFWQSDAKDAINASGDKIDGEKLPAVTQLFTEPYMVHFLIDNTLGAWWVSRNPGVKPPIKFEYLRFLDDGTPAAGKFDGWPDKTAKVTSLDPCMGSGHFVASLFPVFAFLRMQEEGLTKEQATDKVITENLHGLELDARCTQIAAFNLALTAWKFCGYYKVLPQMNLACSGIAPKGKIEDWVKLISAVPRDDRGRMENGMKVMFEHFQLAPELGSLLDPTIIDADAFTANFEQLHPALLDALDVEDNKDLIEREVMAAGIATAGKLLSRKYTLVITNVPYLGQNRHNTILANYCKKKFKDSKADIATVFIERIKTLLKKDCTYAIVSPQNWLFQSAYKVFRIKLLENDSWDILLRMGAGAFSQISGEVVKAILLINTNSKPEENHQFVSIDASKFTNVKEKEAAFKTIDILRLKQSRQKDNPDSIIKLSDVEGSTDLLSSHCYSAQGIGTTDNPQFLQGFWEQQEIQNGWVFFQTAATTNSFISGYNTIFCWEGVNRKYFDHIKKLKAVNRIGGGWQAGSIAWGLKGFGVNVTSKKIITHYSGHKFDTTTGIIVVKDAKKLIPIYTFLSSEKFTEELLKIDQSLSVTEGTLIKVPFDLEYWEKAAKERYPEGLPKPYTSDPIQWLFHGHPIKTENPLQVALVRLLGYRWPSENDSEMELADEAKELIKLIGAFDQLSDDDGIFCIPSVNAEETGAERLRGYLQEVFSNEWGSHTITQLLAKEGAVSSNLEDWLRKEFFIQHCKIFQNRPFIWHIWDGRNDGFSALVNYHKLDKDNLSKLIYTYLGDWIRICEAKKRAGESGAEGLLSAALKLKGKLETILHGEVPYDIFVRWKPLEQQPIGWDPDLNDGVRLNIRPFMEADVLRKKPNIKWGIDRGKNPPGAPWGEIRDNDRHLTLEEKKIAREKYINIA